MSVSWHHRQHFLSSIVEVSVICTNNQPFARQRHHIVVSSIPHHDKKSNSPKFVGLCYSICVFFLVMVLDSTLLNKSYLCLKHELAINVAFYRSGCRDYLFSCKIVMSGRTILKVEFKCFKSHTLHLSIKTRYLRAFVLVFLFYYIWFYFWFFLQHIHYSESTQLHD
jgi:hypothetical protein